MNWPIQEFLEKIESHAYKAVGDDVHIYDKESAAAVEMIKFANWLWEEYLSKRGMR
jgi:hypothetical protein